MKINVRIGSTGQLYFYEQGKDENKTNLNLIGTMEIIVTPIPITKKMVEKTIKADSWSAYGVENFKYFGGANEIPRNARNVRVVYEVEE